MRGCHSSPCATARPVQACPERPWAACSNSCGQPCHSPGSRWHGLVWFCSGAMPARASVEDLVCTSTRSWLCYQGGRLWVSGHRFCRGATQLQSAEKRTRGIHTPLTVSATQHTSTKEAQLCYGASMGPSGVGRLVVLNTQGTRTSGCTTARLLHLHGRLPVHTGQPEPNRARLATLVVHSWGWPQSAHLHCHTTRCPEPRETLLASKPGFLSGLICAAKSGRPSASGGCPARQPHRRIRSR